MPEAVRIVSQDQEEVSDVTTTSTNNTTAPATTVTNQQPQQKNTATTAAATTTATNTARKSLLAKTNITSTKTTTYDGTLTSSEAQQVRTQPLQLADLEDADVFTQSTMEFLAKEDPEFLEKNGTLIDFIKNRKKQMVGTLGAVDEGSTQKQQILEELHVSVFFF